MILTYVLDFSVILSIAKCMVTIGTEDFVIVVEFELRTRTLYDTKNCVQLELCTDLSVSILSTTYLVDFKAYYL